MEQHSLQTGVYYELTMEQHSYETNRAYSFFASEHALAIPIRFQYRIEVAKDFSLFLYTGPSFDFGLAFNIRQETRGVGSLIKPDVEEYNIYKESPQELSIYRVNVMWGVGGGLRWKGLQLRAGGDWGLINMILALVPKLAMPKYFCTSHSTSPCPTSSKSLSRKQKIPQDGSDSDSSCGIVSSIPQLATLRANAFSSTPSKLPEVIHNRLASCHSIASKSETKRVLSL